MTRLVHLFAPLLLGAATSCSAPVGPPDHAVLATRFGPIADLGTISGHVLQKDDASVILIAGDGSLVSIDADTGTYRRATLPCSGQDRCWGLARLADGSLWTLKGMHVVMEVSPQFQSDPGSLKDIYIRSPQGPEVPLTSLAAGVSIW